MGGVDLSQFLASLSAATGAPGGGSAAAMAGALSASLCAMVAGISAKKKPELGELREKALEFQRRFLDLAQQDAAAFEQVMEAWKQGDAEKERALQRAAEVPLRTAETGLECMVLGAELLEKGRKALRTDALSAILLGWAAVRSALLNVWINVRSLPESERRQWLEEKARAYAEKADEELAKVEDALRALEGVAQ